MQVSNPQYSPLQQAILDDNVDEVAKLTVDDSFIYQATPDHLTILELALSKLNPKVIEKVVNVVNHEGVAININANNQQGRTPLMQICAYDQVDARHYEIAQILLEADACIDIKNANQETALSIAEAKGHGRLAGLIRYYKFKIKM